MLKGYYSRGFVQNIGNYNNAATNWSIIRNVAINLARKGGYDSLTKAERFLAHDIDKLFLLLE
jgi:hypothetical protein